MARWIQINGELVEVTGQTLHEVSAPMVMPDIQPYQSQIDGSMIHSRSTHREHLKAHGCFEVGNERFAEKKPLSSPQGLKQTLIGVAAEKLRYR